MGKRGPAKMKLDCGKLLKCARLMMSQRDAADMLDVSAKTLKRRLADEDSDESRAWRKGQAEARQRLRAVQWKLALGGTYTPPGSEKEHELPPNLGAAIWLGKQYLGQKEKQDVTTGDLPFSRFTVNIEKHGGASRETEE